MTGFELGAPLETERLVLRRFREDDLDALFDIHSRADVARYLYWEPRSREQVRAVLRTKIERVTIRVEGDSLAFAACAKDTGELIGDLSLGWTSAPDRTAEIGFIVHPYHHGRGYATEAGRVLIRLAFEQLGCHRVIGRLEARNATSARVLEKLGMRREAHFVENEFVEDEWQSELVYAMLDREWAGSSGNPET